MLHLVWARIVRPVKVLVQIAEFTGYNFVKLVSKASKKTVLIETGSDAYISIV